MTPALAGRLLALPPAIRATLAGVPGPGWYVRPPWAPCPRAMRPFPALERDCAWFPANPAAAVAAVLGCTEREAFREVYVRLVSTDSHDGAVAALSIIEAHVASRSPNV